MTTGRLVLVLVTLLTLQAAPLDVDAETPTRLPEGTWLGRQLLKFGAHMATFDLFEGDNTTDLMRELLRLAGLGDDDFAALAAQVDDLVGERCGGGGQSGRECLWVGVGLWVAHTRG